MRKEVKQVFRLHPGGLVGDLLAEVVALIELLSHYAHDVIGVAVVLGKDDRLGHVPTGREYLREQLILKCSDDGANLVFRHHVAVKLVGCVGQVLLQLIPADLPCQSVPPVNVVPGIHCRALLGDLCANPVGVEVYVHSVGHRLLVVVLHDQVLMEEAEGLLGWSCGQAYEEAVEVLQHLPPQVVDRAVALVRNDDVEGLDGNVGVVLDGRRLTLKRGRVEAGELLQLRGQLFTLQDGVDPLDGGDAHPAHGVDAPGLEELDVVQLGELASFVRGGEPLELAQGLPSQVATVHEEQHSPRSGVLDQAVCLVAGHEGLAASGGHLHQRPRPPCRQGLLQVPDGPLLHRPQARRVQRRHGLQSLAQVVSRQVVTPLFSYPMCATTGGFGDADPLGECLGRMECKDQTASRLRVKPVGELRLYACALVQERERPLVVGKVVGQAGAVLLGLDFHAGQGRTFGLGLDDARRLLVDVEQVVGGAVAGF